MTVERETQSPRWRRFFGGPSKELAQVHANAVDVIHSARLLRISAGELSRKAVEIADLADMLRSGARPRLPSR